MIFKILEDSISLPLLKLAETINMISVVLTSGEHWRS